VRQVLKTIWEIVFLSNAPDTAMTDIQANLFQLFSHSWATVTAQAETRLLFDMSQRDQIRSLPTAGRAVAERTQAAWTDIHDMAHPANGKRRLGLFDEFKPSHGLHANRCRAAPSRLLAREEHRGLF
jgi:hypothetical protein